MIFNTKHCSNFMIILYRLALWTLVYISLLNIRISVQHVTPQKGRACRAHTGQYVEYVAQYLRQTTSALATVKSISFWRRISTFDDRSISWRKTGVTAASQSWPAPFPNTIQHCSPSLNSRPQAPAKLSFPLFTISVTLTSTFEKARQQLNAAQLKVSYHSRVSA